MRPPARVAQKAPLRSGWLALPLFSFLDHPPVPLTLHEVDQLALAIRKDNTVGLAPVRLRILDVELHERRGSSHAPHRTQNDP